MESSKVILVVEDDEAQRKVYEKALKNEGYTVLSAEDSVEANDHAKKHKWIVQLLLADINLPGLTGGEFGEFLKTVYPDLKILYMSGAPADKNVQEHLLLRKASFIQKPFSPRELVQAVKKALNETQDINQDEISKDGKGRYAKINGLQMYYEVHGKGQPLLLIHGGDPTVETSFGKMLPALAMGRQVIAFERQGHGRTADIDRPFTFQNSAEDTVALLRHLEIEKADFLGYSNGGHIALQIALSHPEMVRKLVIVSAMFNREGSDPAFWEMFKQGKLDDMPKELREAYLKVAPHPENLTTFFQKSMKQMLGFKGWTEQEMRSIQAPTLIISGDQDIVKPEHAVLTFRLIPNSQLAILPGTDHMEMVTRPNGIPLMVEAFLDEPMPGPS